jgi:hypothetical protein
MRAGAGPGAVAEFNTVGAKVIDPMEGHDSHSVVIDAGIAGAERVFEVRIAKPITAPVTMTPMATNQRSLAVIDLLAGVGVVARVSVVFFISAHERLVALLKRPLQTPVSRVPVAQPLRLSIGLSIVVSLDSWRLADNQVESVFERGI